MNKKQKICNRCVMDYTDPDIYFDSNGNCNHCNASYANTALTKKTGLYTKRNLEKKIKIIKEEHKNNEYDSIIGLSGGVDSSYLAYIAKKYELNPLVVHFDNGWNSELAVKNIENVVKKLDLDLYTYIIDWEEFKDLQRSFFYASVIDIEMLTDHAIMATMFHLAKKFRVKYVLSGTNTKTESIMPKLWLYQKWDIKNIKSIHKKFGTQKIMRFPIFGLSGLIIYRYILGYEYFEILNYLEYNKQEAKEILKRELEWRDYGGKHYESTFTKFYQGYILPKKFGVDKRKAHLSDLICSGQITRKQALSELKSPPYDENKIRIDKEYVLKKLGFSEEEFQGIMETPPKSHLDYPNNYFLYKILKKIKRNK